MHIGTGLIIEVLLLYEAYELKLTNMYASYYVLMQTKKSDMLHQHHVPKYRCDVPKYC